MEEKTGIKEIELLTEKREQHEQGLREEAVVEFRDECYVLLTGKTGQYHLHHYFSIGTQWVVSYDVRNKSAPTTIEWLLRNYVKPK